VSFPQICKTGLRYHRHAHFGGYFLSAVWDLLYISRALLLLLSLSKTIFHYVLETDISAESGDNRPLDVTQIRKLSVNGIHLVDRMDSNHAFVTELATAGCITWPQREYLINIPQPRDRNDKLLEFVTRRSVGDYENFIKVLSKEQAHLVPLMVTDGGETFSDHMLTR